MSISILTAFTLYVTLLLGYVAGCPPSGSSILLRDGTMLGDVPEWLQGENGTHLNHEEVYRRSIQMIPEEEGMGFLWDDNTVKWCFGSAVSEDDRRILRVDLDAAWKLWVDQGIDERVMRFRPGSPEECAGDRNTYVQVNVPKTDSLSASLGNTGISRMTLSTNPNLAMADRVGNYAHEIGHVWGLLHEMQRPDLWSTARGGTAQEDTFIFNCENLADYDTVLGSADQATIDRRCGTRDGASGTLMERAFSADAFLPYPASSVKVAGDFDRKSIMIYGSRAGGRSDGSGNRAVVYTMQNGDLLDYNHFPSPADIQALNDLYPAPAPDPKPCMAFDPCSSTQTLFRGLKGCITCSTGNDC